MLDPETDTQLKEILSKMVSPEQLKKNPPPTGPPEKPKFQLNIEKVNEKARQDNAKKQATKKEEKEYVISVLNSDEAGAQK